MDLYFPHILMIIWFFISILETIFIYRSVKWYYNSGFTIYTAIGNISPTIQFPIDDNYIKSFFTVSNYYPDLTVYKLADSQFALREKFFSIKIFNYLPIMRGTINIDYNQKTITFIGLLNFSPVLFFIILLYFLAVFAVIILPIALLFLYIPYRIQCKRFSEVFNKIAV